MWDSGQVESPESVDISCAGVPLARGRRYTWQVRVWDENLTGSAWSEPAWFEVELDPVDGWGEPGSGWAGSGRTSARRPGDRTRWPRRWRRSLRRAFIVDRSPAPWRHARLYVTALGLYEARLNGTRVGDAVLAPGWTDYDQRVAYQTYDVTHLLRPGENVIGATARRRLVFRLRRQAAGPRNGNGATPSSARPGRDHVRRWHRPGVITDRGWRGRFAAIRHADLLMRGAH